jgi:hypothetical protein
VTIRVFNYGNTLPAATTFLVAYTVNAGSPTTEMVTLAAPLQSNSTLTYTFTTPVNLSVPGNYTINASLALAGDVTPSNDAFNNTVVTNSAVSVGGTLGAPPPGPSGTLTLSGQTGSIVQWEESPDNQRWFKLANTTTTQDYAGITAQTRYRVRVASGTLSGSGVECGGGESVAVPHCSSPARCGWRDGRHRSRCPALAHLRR